LAHYQFGRDYQLKLPEQAVSQIPKFLDCQGESANPRRFALAQFRKAGFAVDGLTQTRRKSAERNLALPLLRAGV
jgi:hypothetical protein